MQILATVVAALLSCALVLGSTTPTRKRYMPPVSPNTPAGLTARAPEPLPLTNGKRLAIGLPLLPPKRRSANAPRVLTSPVPPPPVRRCNIRMLGKYTGQHYGFIPQLNVNNFYGGNPQFSQRDSLEVSFPISSIAPSWMTFTTTRGGSANFPALGANRVVEGDMGPGRGAYGFLVGTVHRTVPSPPSNGANSANNGHPWETTIWGYNPTTNEIKARWMNPSGSVPLYFMLHPVSFSLFTTGDPIASLLYGVSGVEVTLICAEPL
ncbi:hypothetical protein B0H15DRAFT_867558 [Mycena belliarum]|uniref:Uncharacterized protein n=1 Tax=Mycena belliarum TaxID=1033014 RepID=A0AAD6TNZ8_9AGAR|nr:hypothetical protein B0H15DRAFT_867558 [Mycena belliae]